MVPRKKVTTSFPNQHFVIGVDARPLSTPVSGVGRLIASTLKGFGGDPRFRFLLFSHRPLHPSHAHLKELPNVQEEIGKGFLASKGGLYFSLALPLELRKKNIHLFWGTQQLLPPFFPKEIPAVITCVDFVLRKFPETMRPIARFQQSVYMRWSAERADKILPISRAVAEEAKSYYHIPEEKISVVYPGYDPKEIRISVGKPPTERVAGIPAGFFLSVSTVEPRKNYGFLREAYLKYRQKAGKKALLWIHAGKAGWGTESLVENMRSETAIGSMLWIESPTDAELHYLYSKAGLFLFPSLYEGFGIPLVEALAHGRQCLVSDLNVFREIGGRSVLYKSLANSEDWAKEMSQYSSKPWKLPKADLRKFEMNTSAELTRNVFLDFLEKREETKPNASG
ncbi:glycosyltransferase family 1 protein [Leptospira fletcheri]|uniref:Glycosyltransferase family 1 protein n=1 Tax=Leptospira fletcheri TaxID=2484981 RepID=A0A4R9G3U7_9LEPT|nr:glycosyltransferase family 1 protein [Leptospira fletcheri]TGK06172.1 glycosyltransferase family 1 protein [Leptospira fletcheri]